MRLRRLSLKALKFPAPKPDEPFDLQSISLTSEMIATIPADPIGRSKRKQRARETEPFIHMPVRDFVRGVQALKGAKELAVWVFILRQWRISQPEPVAVTNAGLAAWGVGRRAKYLALDKLAKAGLIRLERQPRRNPRAVPLDVQ
jgi:hypothetical protein